ncbi:phospholipase D-like domain-containing protein [Anaerosalibacter sp. Marseille-P3206]|uniref:phospholipase D-like domain-containing protein n=1 Tax=Anaerosalibacter sp. Marseille-P3206 TaxID=1871005 RepID=UPI0009874728|nr:phospholipase D family protein [Anaerosalibacter sp. Marseille-P3206]
MGINIKSIAKVGNYIFIIYVLYALVLGAIVFGFYKHKDSKYLDTHPVNRFYGDSVGQDRVALVEDRYESGLARINFIENANETIDISYFKIDEGLSADIFTGCLLEAADRGVKIRLLLDGSISNLTKMKDIEYALTEYPNIEFKYYEPINIFKPWAWNNRLHDKIIIVDKQYAMLGGRNIGDRYFAPDSYDGEKTNDRDVVIVNTDDENISSSAISQVSEYYNFVWNHEYSKYPSKRLTLNKKEKGQGKANSLKKYINNLRVTRPNMFNNDFDWMELSLPTNKVTLIHNPIERLNKEPWCFYEITNLMKSAEKSIFIQSPYIIPTKEMVDCLEGVNVSPSKINVLTNSLGSTPNVMAFSGYIRHREDIVDQGVNVYEFQGPGSIHAKSYIFDDRISLVGSFNFDSRSTHLSTETMVVIDSEEFSKALEREVQKDMKSSLMVAEDYSYVDNSLIEEEEIPFTKPIIIRFVSIITYLFDYML